MSDQWCSSGFFQNICSDDNPHLCYKSLTESFWQGFLISRKVSSSSWEIGTTARYLSAAWVRASFESFAKMFCTEKRKNPSTRDWNKVRWTMMFFRGIKLKNKVTRCLNLTNIPDETSFPDPWSQANWKKTELRLIASAHNLGYALCSRVDWWGTVVLQSEQICWQKLWTE